MKKIVGELISHKLFELLVIDEIHCMDQWGNQFRKDYLNLDSIVKSNVLVLGMTSTASLDQVEKIVSHLGIKDNHKFFRYPSVRSNIMYSVLQLKKKDDCLKYIKDTIENKFYSLVGIIFCQKPCDVYEVGRLLLQGGKPSKVSMLHGKGLDGMLKKDTLKMWLLGETCVLVATKTAGTGLDKNNVRFVIHLGSSDSI